MLLVLFFILNFGEIFRWCSTMKEFLEACHVLGSDGTVKNTVFWGRYALKVYAVRFSEMSGKIYVTLHGHLYSSPL